MDSGEIKPARKPYSELTLGAVHKGRQQRGGGRGLSQADFWGRGVWGTADVHKILGIFQKKNLIKTVKI